MIKKLFFTSAALLAVICMTLPGGVEAASIVKIGVIDLQGALNATSEGIVAKEALKEKHLAKQGKINAMQDELASMEEKLKSPVLSEKALSDLKQRYRQKKGELIEFIGKAKEEEERENQALSGRILEGLVNIARDIAAKEGYTVILEKNSSGVVYMQDSLDLTDSVVKIYNEQTQTGSGK